MLETYDTPCLLIAGSDSEGRLKKAEEITKIFFKDQENNPDFLLISPQLSIGIEEVRGLQKFLELKSFKAGKKTAVIAEAQELTPEAQNSLLKTLEEPPPNCQIILCVSELSLVLPTIISRCRIIELSLKPKAKLSKKEMETGLDDFEKLLSSNLGENFVKIEKQALKDRKEAINYLNRLSLVAREVLLSRYKNIEKGSLKIKLPDCSNNDLIMVLSLIADAVKKLEANCNIRLVLDNFMIDINAKIC
ncbi:hypothetical protein C4578_01540 [Candidatus Microgenomates bacterium]|jgi:DNA polymerase III delta prime subunit|nr:MAG: hypothetical protein C4578_01540 [Candidatus Microgenomates bacterium]